ncbi:hypothetical protein WJX74_006837 [Apatococcus lobatus]|uniref:Uncharacterized protein n=1 Tax=Apatococcus lobatus TaxID=904363 RepID=A0AAW1SE79_9CHLO
MNPVIGSALLEQLQQAQKVHIVPGQLPGGDLAAASELRAVAGSSTFSPHVDRAAPVLPLPGSFTSVRSAAAACDAMSKCAGVVSQREGRTIGLLPVAGGASSPGSFVSAPGTVTWARR